MEIRIHVPRPLLTFTAIAVFLLWWTGIVAMNFGVKKAQVDGSGGGAASTLVANATQDFDRERVKQSVLERREEILRYELQILEQEALKEKNPGKLKDLEETRSVLLSIIRQRAESEKLLKLSLEQLWDAEGTVYSDLAPSPGVSFLLPAEPAWGLSATFLDSAYRERFGVPHYAIDIPIAQESAVKAARDGTVLKVALNGLGYSYIVLSHDGQMETVYGHISAAMVKEGERVRAWQMVALSGGRPGTPGAGLLTTGPHLHFGVRVGGTLVDPEPYLPKIR